MKAAIYIRTSTKDQKPENQINECKRFAESRGYEIQGIYKDKLSAYKKEIARPNYDEIKRMAHSGEIKAVIVWAIDRWIRNRDTLLEDITILTSYGCKLHSVKEQYIEAINIEGPIGKTIQEFLLGLIGSLAEMESSRKSERVKIAYQNHKGKKWGRRPLPDRVVQDVIKLRSQGMAMRDIAKSVYYYDKHRNLKPVSKSVVHKIISLYMAEYDTFRPNPLKDRLMDKGKELK